MFNRPKPLQSEKEWVLAGERPATGIRWARLAAIRLYYRLVPVSLSASFTIGGAIVGVLQIAVVLGIAFTPVIAAIYIAPLLGMPAEHARVLTKLALYQAGVLGGAQILGFLLDKTKRYKGAEKRRLQSLSDMSVALGQAIGVLSEQIEKFSASAEANVKRDAFIGNALTCIESTVKLCMGNMESGYCCVSLLTFESDGRVMVRARSNSLGREVGRHYPQEGTMVYWAARYAQQRFPIHHFKAASKTNKPNRLKYRRLSTNQPPPYESILVLPLPPVANPEQNRSLRKGAVTIDTARPYEFLGKEDVILTRVQAYLALINLMLTNHDFGIEPEISS